MEIGLTASTWPDIEPELRTFLGKLVEGWKRKALRQRREGLKAYTSDEADRSLGLRPTSGQPNAA